MMKQIKNARQETVLSRWKRDKVDIEGKLVA
jgi:hypothetical protein